MNSFRLRLDLGLSRPTTLRVGQYPNNVSAPNESSTTIKSARDDINDDECITQEENSSSRSPEFDIAYDDQTTTFAHVLRDIIETRFLGGHLLHFLEQKCDVLYQNGEKDDCKRKDFYVLMHSNDDATVIQPYWSSQSQRINSGNEIGNETLDNQFMLHLSCCHGCQSTEQTTINPSSLVSEFVQKHGAKSCIKDEKSGNPDTKRRRKLALPHVIDLRLTTSNPCRTVMNDDNKCRKPSKINVLFCEEHWRHHGKLLPSNVLCTHKKSTSSIMPDSYLLGNSNPQKPPCRSNEQHHPELKSFLIHDYLGNHDRLLLAVAFIIPTSIIFRGLDAFDGIQLSVDKPSFCHVRTLNVERPAVLRQYFGTDLDDDTPNSDDDDSSPLEREDAVWRTCYGVGSGSRSVGIHPRYSTTKRMTLAMKIIAEEVYEYLRERFGGDDTVVIHPFNHVTVLFYYRKAEPTVDVNFKNRPLLGYHTDNVYSSDGSFLNGSNSQMKNTFTALLTLGDERELHFRRQELSNTNKRKKQWISDTKSLPFSMKQGSLFLLHPQDEKPTKKKSNEPMNRYQHGDVKFPHSYKLSTVLAFRTVTSKEKVHKDTGKLFAKHPAPPMMLPKLPISKGNYAHSNLAGESLAEPELDFLLGKFREDGLIAADERLKELWLSVCSRHFEYQAQK